MTRVVLGAMRGKAAEIRGLELWVLSPRENSREALVGRLSEALELMVAGRWLDLPGGDLPYLAAPWWRKAVGWFVVLGSVAAIGVLLGMFAPNGFDWGPTFTLVGVIVVALLGRLGIAPAQISTGASLFNRKSEGDPAK